VADTRLDGQPVPAGARRGAGDDGWGPDVERRGRRRRPLRLVLLLLVLLLVLALALPFLVAARLSNVPVDTLDDRGAFAGGPTNVLVIGSDSREGLTREQGAELGTGLTEGDRTDTIFVMQVQGGEVALLAFPRDLWVERCDGTTGRINVAQSIGGPSCLVETVRDLSGIQIHAFAGVGFTGFVDIVDAVGGVELCLEEAIQDDDARIDLPAGCQRLDGADALGYARVRKIDNDLERINRQQRFLRALAAEVASPRVLLNPVRVWQLSGDLGDAVVVNDGFDGLDLLRLGRGVPTLAAGDMAAYTVPVTPGTTSGGAAVLYVRESEAAPLFASFRDGTATGGDAPSLSPADVRVTVLNGADVSGLAGRVGELLQGRGYQLVEVGNADIRDRTVVRYPPGERQAADLVVQDLPGDPTRQETSEVTVVTVVLGRDAAGFS
jgi:LCP family protein required for cell wall assembly